MAINYNSRFNFSYTRFLGYRYPCRTFRIGHKDRNSPCICHGGDPFSALPLPDPIRRYLARELGLNDDRAGYSGNADLSDSAPLIDLMHRILHFGMSCGHDDDVPHGLRTGVMVIKGPSCSARSLAYLVPAMEKVGLSQPNKMSLPARIKKLRMSTHIVVLYLYGCRSLIHDCS